MSASDARALYLTFSAYEHSGARFCMLCYSEEDVAQLTTTPLSKLDPDLSRTLLWDSSDHWENADVYRHFLPRILEILGPPWHQEPLYPRHLSETLIRLGFRTWPATERATVVDYLENSLSVLLQSFDEDDRVEWADGIASLRHDPEAADFAR